MLWKILGILGCSLIAFTISRSWTLSYLQRMADFIGNEVGVECYVDVIAEEELCKALRAIGEEEVEEKANELINAYADVGEDRSKWVILTPAAAIKLSREEQNFILAHEIAHHYLGHCKEAKGWFNKIIEGVKEIFLPWHRRDEELAADKCAVQLLIAKELSTRGAVKFFQRMALKEKKYDWFDRVWKRLFGTHPMSEIRLKKIKEYIEDFT